MKNCHSLSPATSVPGGARPQISHATDKLHARKSHDLSGIFHKNRMKSCVFHWFCAITPPPPVEILRPNIETTRQAQGRDAPHGGKQIEIKYYRLVFCAKTAYLLNIENLGRRLGPAFTTQLLTTSSKNIDENGASPRDGPV